MLAINPFPSHSFFMVLHVFSCQICVIFYVLGALYLSAVMRQDISTPHSGGVKDHPDAH